jgi:hypothetical protein
MYVCRLYECNNYKNIEERIGSVLGQFKDKLGSRKEMLHIRYNVLIEIVDFICDNYDKEIEYINTHCQRYLSETIEKDGIIPETMNLDNYMHSKMDIVIKRPGKQDQTHHIDISKWDDTKINTLIEEIVNLCANEKKQIQYDFSTQKNTIALELTWSLLTPYLSLYNGVTKTAWRDKFKAWYSKEKPKQLKIKGIKCVVAE